MQKLVIIESKEKGVIDLIGENKTSVIDVALRDFFTFKKMTCSEKIELSRQQGVNWDGHKWCSEEDFLWLSSYFASVQLKIDAAILRRRKVKVSSNLSSELLRGLISFTGTETLIPICVTGINLSTVIEILSHNHGPLSEYSRDDYRVLDLENDSQPIAYFSHEEFSEKDKILKDISDIQYVVDEFIVRGVHQYVPKKMVVDKLINLRDR